MPYYDNLFKPGNIGSLSLKNRIIMAPMGSNYAEPDGHCSERIQAYYEARAKGGVGLITMGVVSVAFPAGTAEPYQVGISKDEFIPGLKALTDRVHAHGAKISLQLQHAGKTSVRDMAEGREVWVPSMPPPPSPNNDMMQQVTLKEVSTFVRPSKDVPVTMRVMDKADIEQMITWFSKAARRAKLAGFDGIEIHAAHTYIIAGFLSSYYNKRNDEYGGSLENRARLLLEIIAAIKDEIGDDFPLWLRLDAYELGQEGGITLEDCIAVSRMVEKAGLHAISISAYANITSGASFTEAPIVNKPAGFMDWTAKVSESVSIPVIAVGRIEPKVADKAIADGKCSFVAMGRKLLADPELPNKLLTNNETDIRPCIYCYVCVSQIFINQRVKCAANPSTGRESELKLIATNKAKHIVVIGGGPAGIEAALTLDKRGHKVTLLEQGKKLGGTLFFATLAYKENGRLLDYHIRQIEKSSVNVVLGVKATAAEIEQYQPDEVVVATGAKRDMPDLKGAHLPHVWSGEQLRQLLTGEVTKETRQKLSSFQSSMIWIGNLLGITNSPDALQYLSKVWMPLGKNVVIIGGGLVGLELAEFLAERNRQVTVIEPSNDFGVELSIVRRWRVLYNLRALGVTLLKNADIQSIDEVEVSFKQDDILNRTKADTVIVASGITSNKSLADELIAHGFNVKVVGDSNEISYIEGALESGYKTGLAL